MLQASPAALIKRYSNIVDIAKFLRTVFFIEHVRRLLLRSLYLLSLQRNFFDHILRKDAM